MASCFGGAISASVGATDEGIEKLESATMGRIRADMGLDQNEFEDLPLKSLLRWLQQDRDRYNQYSYPFGLPSLREAIANYTGRFYGIRPDPDKEITVTAGATEAISSVLLSTCKRGDRILIIEPFHEMYPSQAELFGLDAVYSALRENRAERRWELDLDEIESQLAAGVRVMILNSPHNPTGKVFSQREFEQLAALCTQFDVLLITDEIY